MCRRPFCFQVLLSKWGKGWECGKSLSCAGLGQGLLPFLNIEMFEFESNFCVCCQRCQRYLALKMIELK